MSSNENLSKRLTEDAGKFSNLQKEYQKLCTTRQQLDEQLNENKIVKEELDLLEDDASVFKLIGPALIKQDLKEAKDNVNGRIKYITAELKRHDDAIKAIETKQLELKSIEQKEAINKMQAQMQQGQPKANQP